MLSGIRVLPPTAIAPSIRQAPPFSESIKPAFGNKLLTSNRISLIAEQRTVRHHLIASYSSRYDLSVEIHAMQPQPLNKKTYIEHTIDIALLCGELCNMLALLVAFIVFYLMGLPFTKD